MNKLYLFRIEHCCSAIIAAPNWKTGRNLALKLPEFQRYMTKLPQITGLCLPGQIDADGKIGIEQVCDSNSAWWTCGSCGGRSFLAIDGGTGYRCKNCGNEGNIPER